MADGEGLPETRLVGTTSFGYLRLRGEGYPDEDLQQWIDQIRAQDWQDVYVFFRHEETAAGPELAARISRLIGADKALG